MKMTTIRTYTELSKLKTFDERFEYLRLNGMIGDETFGYDRYLNQMFYKTSEWRRVRREVTLRDNGCDLGLEGYDIYGRIYIHHMNPITAEDIKNRSEFLLDPEYLVCVSHNTHQAITYGIDDLIIRPPKERSLNDTCPWRR